MTKLTTNPCDRNLVSPILRINNTITNTYNIGSQVFSIVCGSVSADIPITVTTEGARDLGLIAGGLNINYSAAGRSSSEISSTRSVFASSGGSLESNAILTNFNWQNNGWFADGITEDGIDNGTYLSIANGSIVSIPISNLRLNDSKDYSFECRFRIRNVQEYSTLVKTVPKYYYNDENGNPTYIVTYDDTSG